MLIRAPGGPSLRDIICDTIDSLVSYVAVKDLRRAAARGHVSETASQPGVSSEQLGAAVSGPMGEL